MHSNMQSNLVDDCNMQYIPILFVLFRHNDSRKEKKQKKH